MASLSDKRDAPGGPDRFDGFCSLIEQARGGSSAAYGRLLEGCRKYLLLIANDALDSGLRPKGGASDLVQETFVQAQRDLAGFTGTTEQELLAWLKAILNHRIGTQTRRYGTKKRDVEREIPFEEDVGPGQRALNNGQHGPVNAVIDGDEQARLAAAIARLPEHLREVIEMRTWHHHSFPEIAARLEITSEAARKRWSRAVTRLQQELS